MGVGGKLCPVAELLGAGLVKAQLTDQPEAPDEFLTQWPGLLCVAASPLWAVSSLSRCCGHSVLWFFPAVSPHVQRGSSHLAGPGQGCPLNPDPQLLPLPGVGPLRRLPGSGCSPVLLDSRLCVQKLQLLPVRELVRLEHLGANCPAAIGLEEGGSGAGAAVTWGRRGLPGCGLDSSEICLRACRSASSQIQ